MEKNNLRLCAKGSRKLERDFIEETKYLSTIVDCIEIDFNYPHDGNFKQEIAFLKRLQKEKNTQYTVHAQYLSGSINDFNTKIREESIKQILKSIDYASLLKASIVTIHPALEPYGLKLEKRKKLEIDAYKKIVSYATKKKIKIGLENEAQTCFWFPDRACKFDLLGETISKVNNKYFGLTLDIGHANVSNEDYLKVIDKYSKFIYHIHAHDNLGLAPKNLGKFNRPDPHLTLGQGNIRWRQILKKLHDIRYKGYFEIECEIADIKKSIAYLKSI